MQPLLRQIEEETQTSPAHCYQCGRCSAGCVQNIGKVMDLGPMRIMHLLQMEEACSNRPSQAAEYRKRILQSDTIWMCMGCQVCTQRCPQALDIAATMDILRREAIRSDETGDIKKRARLALKGHQAFLDVLLHKGRNDEAALVSDYKLRSGDLLSDIEMAPPMIIKGKLDPLQAIKNVLSLLQSNDADFARVNQIAEELAAAETQKTQKDS